MSAACGCCGPPAGLVPLPVDNRPALSAIGYRVGTYSSFRESLLERISRADGLPSLTTRASDDFAITLLELWAALADVLTFYQERYANEAYLRTAQQRASVARLAQLIGYRLAPGAAATADLVFALDPSAAQSLRLPKGLRIKSVPAAGQTPQTFETLEELAAEAGLNRLRILPPPQAANPFVPGQTEAQLAPGSRGLAAAVALAPGDRVLLFDTGRGGGIEELTVKQVRIEDDRATVAWTNPVRGDAWNVKTRASKVVGSYQLFGHDAPASYMSPTPASGRVDWTLVERSDWACTAPTGMPPGVSALTLEGKVDLPAGTPLLVAAADGRCWLVAVAGTDQVQETFAPLTATVTRVRLEEPFTVSRLDRRSTVVHRLAGPHIRFWGYAFPPTLSPTTVYVAGRRLDATRIEVGRSIVRGAFVPGVELDAATLEPGRAVLLSDGRGPAVTGSLSAASVVGESIELAPAAGDATSLSLLGLGPDASVSGLSGHPLAPSFPFTGSAEIEVTIGTVGPRTIGPIDTTMDLAAQLETLLNAADPTDEFAKARVVPVGRRLVVVAGAVGAVVRCGPTARDPLTVVALGLDPSHARAALVGAPLTGPVALSAGAPSIDATIGATGPRPLDLAALPPDLDATAARLQTLLRAADPAPAFVWSRVFAHDGRLVVLSGQLQADVQDFLRVEVQPADASVVLDAGSASLNGNVARSSNGETVHGETVGSGDAAAAFQSLSLRKQPVTYVPTARAGGLESSLELLVNGVRWAEVPTLFGRGATEQVFTAERAEDGVTTLLFGDGETGSPLPSGQSNVTATYRVGLGLTGRVGAGTLSSALDRPHGLAAVTNPFAADGGADPEAPAEARANAPQTVRTFGRAVSLRDFEDLVRASGEVAKAQAIWVWDGFARAVHLTVAQTGGGAFSLDGLDRLAGSLDAARDPNHPLFLANAVTVPIAVSATLLVDDAHVTSTVLAAARAAIVGAFSFDELELGEPLALSDVFRILQDVDGVTSVDVDALGFKQRAGVSAADFDLELTRRGVERTGTTPNPVQSRLRIFPARPDRDRPGAVLPAELATLETPGRDVTIAARGGLTA